MAAKPTFALTLPSTVVVTGAASGLGHELCRLLLESGVDTVGVDRAAAPEDLRIDNRYAHVTGSVSEEATWNEVNALLDKSGTTSVGLVTAAAILEAVGSILETSKETLVRTLDVNVVGTAMAIKALLPRMIANGGGQIVAVGSVSGSFGEQQLSAYTASKAAVRGLARTIAMDHARQGIRVNVLSPGPMMAGLFKRHMDSAADSKKFEATRANRQPAGKILDPRDVAQAAMFLLSDQSGAFIGEDLMADGGLSTSFDFRTGAEGASI
mgnify:CR=1 FL=1